MAPSTPEDLLSPPFIPVSGLPNFRDCGGYPIASEPGKVVRRGVLFRAAELSGLTDEGIAALRRLRVSRVYDLRSALEMDKIAQARALGQTRPSSSAEAEAAEEEEEQPEVETRGKPRPHGTVVEWEGATRCFTPVFLQEDYSPEMIALRYRDFADSGSEGFVRCYARILALGAQRDHPHRPFPTILGHLAGPASPVATPDTAPSPILVHCTAGKDRTGVICAVVLSLCGVPDEAVAQDYALTEVGLGPRREAIVTHLMSTEALRDDRVRAERMIGSRKEAMLGTLAYIRETYGSVESYVIDGCGLTPAAVAQLRSNLVVDVSEENPLLDWEAHAAVLEGYLKERGGGELKGGL